MLDIQLFVQHFFFFTSSFFKQANKEYPKIREEFCLSISQFHIFQRKTGGKKKKTSCHFNRHTLQQLAKYHLNFE